MTYQQLEAVCNSPRKRPDAIGRKRLTARVWVAKGDDGVITVSWASSAAILTFAPTGRVTLHIRELDVVRFTYARRVVNSALPGSHKLTSFNRLAYWFDESRRWNRQWLVPYRVGDWVDADANHLEAALDRRNFVEASSGE